MQSLLKRWICTGERGMPKYWQISSASWGWALPLNMVMPRMVLPCVRVALYGNRALGARRAHQDWRESA